MGSAPHQPRNLRAVSTARWPPSHMRTNPPGWPSSSSGAACALTLAASPPWRAITAVRKQVAQSRVLAGGGSGGRGVVAVYSQSLGRRSSGHRSSRGSIGLSEFSIILFSIILSMASASGSASQWPQRGAGRLVSSRVDSLLRPVYMRQMHADGPLRLSDRS